MNASIDRKMPPSFQTIAVTDAAGTSATVLYEGASGGRIYIPAASSITSLAFHDAPNDALDNSTTTYTAQDGAASPAAVALTVEAGKSYPIPDAMFGARNFRMVGNVAGTVYVTTKG